MGVEYAQLAELLAAVGYRVAVKTPEGECKCPDKSRKCLEKLSHTFLTYTTPSQVRQKESCGRCCLTWPLAVVSCS